jgi:hypothetical protein
MPGTNMLVLLTPPPSREGDFNGLPAYHNIHTDTDLGIGWAAICGVACGCAACKAQLEMAVTRQEYGWSALAELCGRK